MAQPAIPQELQTQVVIYRKQVTGAERTARGQKLYSWFKHRTVKVATKRSKSDNQLLQHNATTTFQDYIVGNWWDWMDVTAEDMVLRVNDKAQFGLIGNPVNFQQQNRWAIMELASSSQCLPGIPSGACEQNLETPLGTEDVEQEIAAEETPPE